MTLADPMDGWGLCDWSSVMLATKMTVLAPGFGLFEAWVLSGIVGPACLPRSKSIDFFLQTGGVSLAYQGQTT